MWVAEMMQFKRRAVGTQCGKTWKFIFNYLISHKNIKFTMREVNAIIKLHSYNEN